MKITRKDTTKPVKNAKSKQCKANQIESNYRKTQLRVLKTEDIVMETPLNINFWNTNLSNFW